LKDFKYAGQLYDRSGIAFALHDIQMLSEYYSGKGLLLIYTQAHQYDKAMAEV